MRSHLCAEFDDIWTLIQGWSQGVLGRIIALGALIVGIAFGLVRQSVVAAVIGISMAIVLQYGPDVIEGIVTSTAAGAWPRLRCTPSPAARLRGGGLSYCSMLIASRFQNKKQAARRRKEQTPPGCLW